MAKKMKWTDYLVWGGIAAVAYVIADSMGLLNSIKTAAGVEQAQSRVAYYASPRTNGPLGANAYLGEAYSLGQQSMSGDYNSISMVE